MYCILFLEKEKTDISYTKKHMYSNPLSYV